MNCNELIEHRQLRAVQNRSRSQCSSVGTVLALPFVSVLLPVMMNTTTLRAADAVLQLSSVGNLFVNSNRFIFFFLIIVLQRFEIVLRQKNIYMSVVRSV